MVDATKEFLNEINRQKWQLSTRNLTMRILLIVVCSLVYYYVCHQISMYTLRVLVPFDWIEQKIALQVVEAVKCDVRTLFYVTGYHHIHDEHTFTFLIKYQLINRRSKDNKPYFKISFQNLHVKTKYRKPAKSRVKLDIFACPQRYNFFTSSVALESGPSIRNFADLYAFPFI
jgi:hypothetical protein